MIHGENIKIEQKYPYPKYDIGFLNYLYGTEYDSTIDTMLHPENFEKNKESLSDYAIGELEALFTYEETENKASSSYQYEEKPSYLDDSNEDDSFNEEEEEEPNHEGEEPELIIMTTSHYILDEN